MTVATTLEHRLTASRPDLPMNGLLDRGGCGRTAVVTVRGDLDATSVDQFQRVLGDAFATCCDAVVIDLSAADFVSIGAAARLVDARRQALRSRVELALVSGSPAVEHVLRVTGIHSLFRVHCSLPSALAHTARSEPRLA